MPRQSFSEAECSLYYVGEHDFFRQSALNSARLPCYHPGFGNSS